MQSARVFSAPSLADVLAQLQMYALSGVLMIRCMSVAQYQQQEATLLIEQGQPLSIRRGQSEELICETTLRQLIEWGEICFIFHPNHMQLQLQAPDQPRTNMSGRQPQQPTPTAQRPPRTTPAFTRPLPAFQPGASPQQRVEQTHPRLPAAQPYQHTKNTTPLPAVRPHSQSLANTGKVPRVNATNAHTRSRGGLHPDSIPTLTAVGRQTPVQAVPRYDRTILLLINGRRSVTELAQLTRRPLADVRGTLQRLHAQQIIAGI